MGSYLSLRRRMSIDNYPFTAGLCGFFFRHETKRVNQTFAIVWRAFNRVLDRLIFGLRICNVDEQMLHYFVSLTYATSLSTCLVLV